MIIAAARLAPHTEDCATVVGPAASGPWHPDAAGRRTVGDLSGLTAALGCAATRRAQRASGRRGDATDGTVSGTA